MIKPLFFLLIPLLAAEVGAQTPRKDVSALAAASQADREFLAALSESPRPAPVDAEPPPHVAPEPPPRVAPTPTAPVTPVAAAPAAGPATPAAPVQTTRVISRSEPVVASITKQASKKREVTVRKTETQKSAEPIVRRAVAVIRTPPVAALGGPRGRTLLKPFETSSRRLRTVKVTTTTTVSSRTDRDKDDDDDDDDDDD